MLTPSRLIRALVALAVAVTLIAPTEARQTARAHGGGFLFGPLPPALHTVGSTRLPASFSLARYSQRIHDQGSSNSCVGQTLATIAEITEAERYGRRHGTLRGYHQAFSSGYVWNLTTNGYNAPITYSAAFYTAGVDGVAPLAWFSPDGHSWDYWLQPTYPVIAEARHYRTGWFRSVGAWDRGTMENEIHAGRPLAVAFTVYSSFLNHTYGGVYYGDSGYYEFAHSMTAVGYNSIGLVLQNSWGARWGNNGRLTVSWGYLGAVNASIVASGPASPLPRPYVKPKPFPVRKWGRTVYKSHGRLTWAASVWLHHQWLGKHRNHDRWYGPTRGRRYGYMRYAFVHGHLYCWKHSHSCKASKR